MKVFFENVGCDSIEYKIHCQRNESIITSVNYKHITGSAALMKLQKFNTFISSKIKFNVGFT